MDMDYCYCRQGGLCSGNNGTSTLVPAWTRQVAYPAAAIIGGYTQGAQVFRYSEGKLYPSGRAIVGMALAGEVRFFADEGTLRRIIIK
jgi:hypothetical protein